MNLHGWGVSQCLQDNSQAPINTINVQPHKTKQAKKQKAERLANAELRADNLKNDPQKCQETPQKTQVDNTNHQMYTQFESKFSI